MPRTETRRRNGPLSRMLASVKKKESVLTVNGISVTLERKRIKSIRLRICPPDGRVKLSAPFFTGEGVLRAFVASREEWIRDGVEKVRARSAAQRTAEESGDAFPLWGTRYRLCLTEEGSRYHLTFSGTDALFTVPLNSTAERHKAFLNDFYRGELKDRASELLPVWEERTGLYASGFSVRDMTSRWGSCNVRTRHILLNLELAKKPPECLEYVLLHELAHLKVAAHNKDFYAILDRYMPGWKQIKNTLESFPETEP